MNTDSHHIYPPTGRPYGGHINSGCRTSVFSYLLDIEQGERTVEEVSMIACLELTGRDKETPLRELHSWGFLTRQ